MTIRKHFWLLAIPTLFLSACASSESKTDKKIDQLLSKMTLVEKIGQMNQVTSTGMSGDMKGLINGGNVGSILNEMDIKTINKLQRLAVEESRLGIPILFSRDVIHGFKTIFPIPLGQAATWNPQIVEDGARIAAIEATSQGIRWTFAPMIDVTRDPRWGRVAESCGEDPYLTGIMGQAMIKGFQGDSLSNPTSMAACAKHFAGYGATESGKDYNTTWIPEVQLRDTYLPPFKAAVKAGAASFMCSFNDINGVPSSANVHLNKDILRDEWKYDGLLVSDWGSIQEMINHGVCTDLKEAAQKAMLAGVDMDMMGYAYISHLKELVESGEVSEKLIDESVRNILRLKFKLGLFDNPYVQESVIKPLYTDVALEKAKQAAIESAVLLKNENALLPLTEKVRTVAVIGPLSDAPADQLGTWCFDAEPEHSVTPLAAIQKMYGDQVKVIAEKGLTYSREKSAEGIAKAVRAAQKADVVLLFLGEEAVLSGEARCRADINLPGDQNKLIEAINKTGKPIVMVIMAGRPLTIAKEMEMADAVLYAFHGGTMAGPALADLIFGKAVPSGKLPITLPRMVGQIPIYYAHKNTGRPATDIDLIDDIPVGAAQTSVGFSSYHLDAGDSPLFPFGFGLSYTTFQYSEMSISASGISMNDSLTVACEISNTGKVDASEVAQLYIQDMVGSLARPVRELKGFQKVRIKAGQTQKVSFTIDAEMLEFCHADGIFRAEPGTFQLWISPDSQSGSPEIFTLKK